MCNDISIRTWIENFDRGMYEAKDVNTQIEAGWYDWFCRDSSLWDKTNTLAPKVKRIAKSPKVNVDTMYVFFKNNCPFNGQLYDDFRICDLESGDVIFTIIPRSGHKSAKGRAEVWGRENDFEGPLFMGNWKQVKEWFGV